MNISNIMLAGCVFLSLAGISSAQPQSDDALSARVDAVVRTQMSEQKIPGTSLAVIRDGKVIKATGYGLANVELNVPVTSASIFQSGSIGKQFTATAVMMLAEEGKVGLDDSITKYFPEAPPTWKPITIRHLLTHTSGLPDVWGQTEQDAYSKGIVDSRRDYTEDELLQRYVKLQPEFQPGDRWEYCSTGYQLLGFLIHRLTGKFHGEFIRERIFQPLGMDTATVISEADIVPNRSSGYIMVKGELKNQEWIAPSLNTTADGAYYMTVLDLAKWDAALYTEKVLKKSSLDQMWTPVRLNPGKTNPDPYGSDGKSTMRTGIALCGTRAGIRVSSSSSPATWTIGSLSSPWRTSTSTTVMWSRWRGPSRPSTFQKQPGRIRSKTGRQQVLCHVLHLAEKGREAMKGWKSISILWLVVGLSTALYAQSHDDGLSARVDAVVRAQMSEQKIPGVSLAVMRDGKIIKATGYGLANLELNTPVTPESVFHTESVGKTFTAVGVLILVEEGKVGLDDKITKYFSESPTWKDVTVRQLLTHTSGIPDYVGEFGGKALVDLQKNYSEDEVVRIIASQPLDFQPGEKRAYSNSGYVILGALIRRVTGKNWADFVQERIFGPLGMNSTRVISEADIIPNRTSGYHLVNGQWKNTDWVAPSLNTLADGTLYTNVIDMAKWDEALSTEKILKRTTLDQMWVPIKLNSGETFPQGLCFRIDNVNGHRLAWKDGEFQGYTTIMSRYLDDHLTVVVLTNLGEDANIPLHIAEGVAAIYIPGLGGPGAKAAPSNTLVDTGEIAAGPEMDRLKFYIGDWAYTEEYPKSELFPNGGHNTGRWSAQRGPDGLSAINTFASHGGGDNYQGMEVMMWDPKAKAYRDNALWYDSPDRWIFTGNFEGETLAYRGEFAYLGKQVKFRSETRPIAAGGFTLTEFASVNGGPEQLLLVGRAEKKNNAQPTSATAAAPEDTATIEGILDASFKALTGPVGAPRDWSRYRSLCDPAIRLVSSSINDKGKQAVTRWNLETYMADADDYLVKTGFEDRKLACTSTRFGNVATATCGFEGLEGAKVVERGVAMYQLYNDGKRWWINSVVWERERPGNPIPRDFLPKN